MFQKALYLQNKEDEKFKKTYSDYAKYLLDEERKRKAENMIFFNNHKDVAVSVIADRIEVIGIYEGSSKK